MRKPGPPLLEIILLYDFKSSCVSLLKMPHSQQDVSSWSDLEHQAVSVRRRGCRWAAHLPSSTTATSEALPATSRWAFTRLQRVLSCIFGLFLFAAKNLSLLIFAGVAKKKKGGGGGKTTIIAADKRMLGLTAWKWSCTLNKVKAVVDGWINGSCVWLLFWHVLNTYARCRAVNLEGGNIT